MVNTDTTSDRADYFINLENEYGAFNYKPLPVVIERGEGVYVYDVNGKSYLDFLSAYSALNQGHCHPRLVKKMQEQCGVLTLTSRAFHNNLLGEFEKYICNLLRYDRVLPMNTGVEAAETAIKLARRWGYRVKGIKSEKAKIIVASGNFWGRTIAAISASTDPSSYTDFGPYLPGFIKVPYNDIESMKSAMRDYDICGVMLEPIQGEAGVVVPDAGYLTAVNRLCKDKGCLFIADEIQTGLGRTGKMLACDHESVSPDILILGKALSGGMMPVSAVLANDEVMLTIKPGEHGSTFGGNPLACAIAMESLQIILDEDLCNNAARQGNLLRSLLHDIKSSRVTEIRGKGLLNALVIPPFRDYSAVDICMAFMKEGLLAKQTHRDIIRLACPLTIKEAQIRDGADIIQRVLNSFE